MLSMFTREPCGGRWAAGFEAFDDEQARKTRQAIGSCMRSAEEQE